MHIRKTIQLLLMKARAQKYLFNTRFLLLAFSLLFLLFLTLRSRQLLSSSYDHHHNTSVLHPQSKPSCTKIPPSLANTIIHYSTSNTTPQQTPAEISVTARVLARKSPCNFLIFGLGHDSLMWSALNHGGRTVFLEEDTAWIAAVRGKHPELEAYSAAYNTKVSDAEDLMEAGWRPECTVIGDLRVSKCRLALKELPGVVYEVEWDLIMVDAPTGWVPEAPGRMGAIYTAGMAARQRREGETDVFVHDVDRAVEDRFSKAFLCEGYMRGQEGRLRHFTIPSHSAGRDMCPSAPHPNH